MPLVEYSDSDSSESEKIPSKGTKRKRISTSEKESSLPPLPDTFHDLYASTTRASNQDDPTLHGGRQRVTPHVEGNWPTHVYIEWHPSTDHSNRLDDVLNSVSQGCNSSENGVYSLLKSDLGAELPLHISLSRSLTLLAHQRQPFTDALINSITKANLRPFSVPAPTFDWVANYEKTRWFLVMKLSRPAQNELNALLRISNQIAQSFGQLPLYAEPQPIMGSPISKRSKPPSPSTQNPASEDMSSNFHISIAWTLHPPSQSMLEQIQHLNHDFPALQIPIQTIKAKIGNTVSSIPLASKTDSSNKILE